MPDTDLLAEDTDRANRTAMYYRALRDAGVPDSLAHHLARDWHAQQLAVLHPPALSIDEALEATIRSALRAVFTM